MYESSLIARYEPLRYLDATTIAAGGWCAIPPEFTHSIRLIRITNATDADLEFTYNTDRAEIFVPAYTSYVDDIAANAFKTDLSGILILPLGFMLYVRMITEIPSIKGVYISAMYGDDAR